MPNIKDLINSMGDTVKKVGQGAANAFMDVGENPQNPVAQFLDSVKVPFAGVQVPAGSMVKDSVFGNPQSHAENAELSRLSKIPSNQRTPEEEQAYRNAIQKKSMDMTMAMSTNLEGASGAVDDVGTKLTRDMRFNQGNWNPRKIADAAGNAAEDIGGAIREPSVLPKAAKAGLPPIEAPTPVSNLPDIPVREGNAPVKVRLEHLKNNPWVTDREAAAQAALDKWVPGNSAGEVLQNIPRTIEDLGTKIKTKMSSNPKSVGIGDVLADYDANLSREGIYRTSGSGMKKSLLQEAEGYMRDLNESMFAGTPHNPNQIPDQIQDQDLFDLKKMINNDYKGVKAKLDAGGSLTDRDKVISAARQTVDDAVSRMHPEVKELTLAQSGLYDANASAYGARDVEEKSAEAARIAAEKAAANAPKTAIGKFLSSPVGHVAEAALAGGALVKGPDILGKGVAMAQNYLPKFGGNSKQQAPVESTNTPSFEMTTPLDDGTLENEQQFAQKQGQLQQELESVKLSNPQRANEINGQIQANQTQYNAQSGLRDLSKQTQLLGSTANEAMNQVKITDPGFMNVLSSGYDEMSRASNGQYAALAADLKQLEDLSGVPLHTATSAQALQAGIEKIVKMQQRKLETSKQAYFGGNAQKREAPVQAQQAAPAQDAQLPPGFSITGGSAPGFLPPIQ